jgi:hypothetical protein
MTTISPAVTPLLHPNPATDDPIPYSPPSSPQPFVPMPPNEALSTNVSTTTPVTDLLESLGVLAAGATIPLLWVGTLASGGAAVAAVGALWWAWRRRTRKSFANEEDVRALRYVFSPEQLSAAVASGLGPDAVGVMKVLRPGEKMSRWQLSYLLATQLGDGRATEVLPLVLRYAHVETRTA